MHRLPSERGFDVLLKLDDENLYNMCRVDRYYRSICEDDYFWQLRTEKYYGAFLHLRKYFEDWKDFYRTLSRDTVYLVVQGEFVNMASSLDIAFDMLKVTMRYELGPRYREIRNSSIKNAQILKSYKNMVETPIQIYIMMAGIEVHLGDPDFLILSVGGEEEFLPSHLRSGFYLRKDFSFFPPLSSQGSFIFFIHNPPGYYEREWANLVEIAIGVERINQESIDKMFQYVKKGELFKDQFDVIPMNVEMSEGVKLNQYYYAYGAEGFIRHNLPPRLIFYDDKDEEYKVVTIPDTYYDGFLEPDDDVGAFQYFISSNKHRLHAYGQRLDEKNLSERED